jgi:hypothetical protein
MHVRDRAVVRAVRGSIERIKATQALEPMPDVRGDMMADVRLIFCDEKDGGQINNVSHPYRVITDAGTFSLSVAGLANGVIYRLSARVFY